MIAIDFMTYCAGAGIIICSLAILIGTLLLIKKL
jgi:hypothetical protein